MKKFSKRLSAILALTTLLTVVGGCGKNQAQPTAANEKKAEEKVKIRVVTTFTGDDPWKGPWQEAMKDFMAKNPNIEIVDEATPTQGQAIQTKVKTDFASGSEPDVTYFLNGVDTKPLLESGKIIDWEEEFKKDPEWAKTFSKLAMEASKYNGKLYALPYLGFYEGLLVNKDLFEKNNVKIPTNYEELLTAIDAFNKIGIIPMAQSLMDSRYLVEYTILSIGGPKGHAAEYDSSWAEGLKTIKELNDKGAFPKDALTLTDEAAQSLFKDKKAAMIINGSWVVGGVKDKDNTVVSYFPLMKNAKADPKDIIAGCGWGWYMSKSLNEKKNGAPLKLIKYMTSPEVMSKFGSVAGVPEIKTNTAQVSKATQSGWDFLAGAKSTNAPIDSFISPDAFKTILDGVPYIVGGKKTAEDVLEASKKLNKK